jgi:type I pantothenate kinase
MEAISRYRTFDRAQWAALRAAIALPLSEEELDGLRGINEAVSMAEVEEVYLPLSRLLNLRVAATQALAHASDAFLGQLPRRVPFIIGLGGSVAVGKSTTARIMQTLLARWPDHPRVDLITTDGFLLPNVELEQRGLMDRKGFPESYDVRRLLAVLAELKGGSDKVEVPVYSHVVYDVVPDEMQVVREPEIVILEGLNVLQAGDGTSRHPLFVSDFFDFSIYVDASEAHIERWYVERFHALRGGVFTDERSFFHRFASLSDGEATDFAHAVWRSINRPNLVDNILPTRERADLILEKGADHAVERVHLRLR